MSRTITLVEREGFKKPWTCQLCGVADDDVDMYCGGYVMFAHPKCGEIGNKAIALHLRRIAYDTNSLEFLVQEFHEIYNSSEETKNVE